MIAAIPLVMTVVVANTAPAILQDKTISAEIDFGRKVLLVVKRGGVAR